MSEKARKSLLQRLSTQVRAQDWLAVIIELVIVVVGIFLGFQLTEWNAHRQERAREQVYMLNVAGDLRDDVGEMSENVRTAESRMAALDLLLRKSGQWNPPAAFPSSRYPIKVEKVPPFNQGAGYTLGIEAFILSSLDGNRFAYDTMISGDGLSIIHNKAMLGEIQTYYAGVDEVRDFEASQAVNRLRFIDALQEEGVSAVSGESLDQLAAIVRAHPPLRAAAENYWLYANRHVFLTRKLNASADALADKIEAEYQASGDHD